MLVLSIELDGLGSWDANTLAIRFPSEADRSARRFPALAFVNELYNRCAMALLTGVGLLESGISSFPVQLAERFARLLPFIFIMFAAALVLVKSVDCDL